MHMGLCFCNERDSASQFVQSVYRRPRICCRDSVRRNRRRGCVRLRTTLIRCVCRSAHIPDPNRLAMNHRRWLGDTDGHASRLLRMRIWFEGQLPIVQALLGGLFTWLVTAIGAATAAPGWGATRRDPLSLAVAGSPDPLAESGDQGIRRGAMAFGEFSLSIPGRIRSSAEREIQAFPAADRVIVFPASQW